MRELHDQLNTKALASQEEWPYMPHLTIVKMSDEAQAQQAYRVARERWAHFKGSRDIQVSELTFVREDETELLGGSRRSSAGPPTGLVSGPQTSDVRRRTSGKPATDFTDLHGSRSLPCLALSV